MKKLALLLTASALCLSPLSTNAESIDTGFGQSSDRIVVKMVRLTGTAICHFLKY